MKTSSPPLAKHSVPTAIVPTTYIRLAPPTATPNSTPPAEQPRSDGSRPKTGKEHRGLEHRYTERATFHPSGQPSRRVFVQRLARARWFCAICPKTATVARRPLRFRADGVDPNRSENDRLDDLWQVRFARRGASARRSDLRTEVYFFSTGIFAGTSIVHAAVVWGGS